MAEPLGVYQVWAFGRLLGGWSIRELQKAFIERREAGPAFEAPRPWSREEFQREEVNGVIRVHGQKVGTIDYDGKVVIEPTPDVFRVLLLEEANRVYGGGEAELAMPIAAGERGDTLADFIVREVEDVIAESGDLSEAIESAQKAMDTAAEQLRSVAEALSRTADTVATSGA